ncbi:MAG: hypothetical protein ACJATP_002668 [Candidatus Azotimanducaceae bacterium]|jgi:hypothetical protein
MRYIVVALMLMNASYFGYHYWRALKAAPVIAALSKVVPGLPGVEQIRLLREVQGDAGRDRQLSRVINNPLQQSAAADNAGVSDGADGSYDVDLAARADLAGIADMPDVGPPASDEAFCQVFGPLNDLFTGQALVEKLKLYDMQTTLQALDKVAGGSDYRVVIPPAKSPQDAFRKLRELKSSDIDSYVITQGPDELGISLGLFSSLAAAESASADLAGDGYVTQVREIPRLLREFWVYGVTNMQRLSVDAVIWQAILIEYPEIEQKMRLCIENNPSDV